MVNAGKSRGHANRAGAPAASWENSRESSIDHISVRCGEIAVYLVTVCYYIVHNATKAPWELKACVNLNTLFLVLLIANETNIYRSFPTPHVLDPVSTASKFASPKSNLYGRTGLEPSWRDRVSPEIRDFQHLKNHDVKERRRERLPRKKDILRTDSGKFGKDFEKWTFQYQ